MREVRTLGKIVEPQWGNYLLEKSAPVDQLTGELIDFNVCTWLAYDDGLGRLEHWKSNASRGQIVTWHESVAWDRHGAFRMLSNQERELAALAVDALRQFAVS